MNVRFKIIRFYVNHDAAVDFGERDEGWFRLMHKATEWSGDLKRITLADRVIDCMYSPPILACSEVAESIRHSLGELGPTAVTTWSVIDVTDEYELVLTSATAAYDYTEYNFEIGTLKGIGYNGRDERLVALQKERAEYQKGRYRSGMHSVRVIK